MRDTRLHNAAMLYAHAYPSDPFAYVRMKRDLSLGIYDRERIVEHAEAVLAERRGALERKAKEWRNSPLRKALFNSLFGKAAA